MERKEKGKKPIYKYLADHGDLYEDIYKMCKTVHINIRNSEDTKRTTASAMSENGKESAIEYVLCYPIMLFGGDIYECGLMGPRTHTFPTDHILLWHTISTKNLKGEYFIDMVEESYLKKYLKLIDEEIKEIVRRFVQQRQILRESSYQELIEIKKFLSKMSF